MSKVYFAMEAIGVLVILILLYANIFEIKQKTKKNTIFTQLLIVNAIEVVADAVSWLSLDWKRMSWLLATLITVAYVLPFLMQTIFSSYLYEHLSEKVEAIPADDYAENNQTLFLYVKNIDI